MTNSLLSLSPDSQLLLGQEMRAAAGVRSPEDLFILLPAPQQLSTAFRQMISAFNWTFLVLLDRRTDLLGAGYSISVTIMDIFLL